MVTSLLTLSQRVENLSPYSLPIETLHKSLIKPRKKPVFDGRIRICAESVRVVIGSAGTDRQGEVDYFIRPYVFSFPDRNVQWIIIMEATVLEGS